MLEGLSHLASTGGFMPQGYCFLWTPTILWSHILSDVIIAGSYFSIPFGLWYFTEKRTYFTEERTDLPLCWNFVMSGIFVMACGSMHLFSIRDIRHADYRAEAGMKAVTAAASIVTAIKVLPMMKRIAWKDPGS